jgi:hypothetical protein
VELSTWVLAARLPELDRVAFGIGQPREPSVRVDLRVYVDRDASFAKLRGHPVEIADSEVDHPLETQSNRSSYRYVKGTSKSQIRHVG